MDLRIVHERWGSTSNPSLNGHLHYPTDIDRTLNETGVDKLLQYRTDYNNPPSHDISFMTTITSTSGCLLFLQADREIDRFLAAQEFIQRKPTSTSEVRRSPNNSSPKWVTS